MEALLSGGLGRLHLRKPGAGEQELEVLVGRLAPRWAERLVLHGPKSRELALRYGVPNVHGAVAYRRSDARPRQSGADGPTGSGADGPTGRGTAGPTGRGAGGSTGYSGGGPAVDASGLVLSTSVHGWEEFSRLPRGLAYAFISPLFDSISKRGYRANAGLLKQPDGELPCVPVGLGGVSGETIGSMLEHGWKGAAVLGWIWENPQQAVKRLEELQKIIEDAT